MASKVAEAINRYKTTVGTEPEIWYANTAFAGTLSANRVKIVGSVTVLTNHI